MNITRRNFLKIPLAASVAVALPVLAKTDKPNLVSEWRADGTIVVDGEEVRFRENPAWEDISGNGNHFYLGKSIR